ncbi:hypothetical protein E0F76_17775 [Flavobacterium cellulosilyticum]|uniref:Carboxypeptidase-like regulatory domain-containing protein n=2 Tax=Flavobacterium cellulosilyticum TaxID=2541731 RepID=A0A4R5CAC0_9FLAO|nr:hypothetical protein E0F76_17775 [Flavobacterium cellulosilyticum]
MKNKIGILFLFLFYQFSVAQILTRIPLRGQVVNDSIQIDNGIVFNINAKTGTVISPKGYFTILAKVNDTLVFSSLAFKSKKIRLSSNEFSNSYLRVKLEIFAKQLIEVVVFAKKGIHPIEGNTQAIVDKQYFDDEKSSSKNRAMPPDGTIENGMDFVRMYKDILKILQINNPERTDFITPASFTEVAMKTISYSFYTNTLKLKEDEIGLFLIYCENDSKSKTLLKPKSKIELIDFLITKNDEFNAIITSENEK